MSVAISVIIATKNRPEDVTACLRSVANNTFRSYEVLLIDQSANTRTKQAVSMLRMPKVRYIHISKAGKSLALNTGLTQASGQIVAFTDDDCLVDDTWLTGIHTWFTRHPDAMGVFGSTLATRPQKGRVCPATFSRPKDVLINDPFIIHYTALGDGNNMSFRKSATDTVGPFATWLGPGTVAMSAEISDYVFRMLLHGYPLGYTRSIIVRHNRWLTPTKETLLQGTYTVGASAFAVYHILRGHARIHAYISDRIRHRVVGQLTQFTSQLARGKMHGAILHTPRLISSMYECLCLCFGVFVGFVKYLSDATAKTSNNTT